jgi:hypothetical protein
VWHLRLSLAFRATVVCTALPLSSLPTLIHDCNFAAHHRRAPPPLAAPQHVGSATQHSQATRRKAAGPGNGAVTAASGATAAAEAVVAAAAAAAVAVKQAVRAAEAVVAELSAGGSGSGGGSAPAQGSVGAASGGIQYTDDQLAFMQRRGITVRTVWRLAPLPPAAAAVAAGVSCPQCCLLQAAAISRRDCGGALLAGSTLQAIHVLLLHCLALLCCAFVVHLAQQLTQLTVCVWCVCVCVCSRLQAMTHNPTGLPPGVHLTLLLPNPSGARALPCASCLCLAVLVPVHPCGGEECGALPACLPAAGPLNKPLLQQLRQCWQPQPQQRAQLPRLWLWRSLWRQS